MKEIELRKMLLDGEITAKEYADGVGKRESEAVKELWFARDKDGTLWSFDERPYILDGEFVSHRGSVVMVEHRSFPGLTFQNSPMRASQVL